MKINRQLLPIKAHYFFFFAALGPILPQVNVFGRQLGVSPGVMGFVTAVLPLLWAAAKPTFGYVVDYWPNQRKFVFMLLILLMSGSYCCLWFLPMPEESQPQNSTTEHIYQLNNTVYLRKFDQNASELLEKFHCNWSCDSSKNFTVYLPNSSYINTLVLDENRNCTDLLMDFDHFDTETVCVPRENCNLYCYEDSEIDRTKREVNETLNSDDKNKMSLDDSRFYMTAVFWVFVVLICIGTVAFNVANCIGDAVCFDVLGAEKSAEYGNQRLWGTFGYGITALAGGWLVDLVSTGTKDFTPAFLVTLGATIVDLYSCTKLRLPPLSSPTDSGKALKDVLKIPRVILFIIFAIVAGTFDSFIIYYMFWFLEELAEETGTVGKIKLIEGVVVAAESFVGEILFFYLSGRILQRWGYRTTLTFCLFCYGVRMLLISLIQHPWHLVFIEAIMQGPTYALCYSTIVGYAAHCAPKGYSATVQGLVAGMDDGLGFAVGSLVGGQLYSVLGGRGAFRCFALVAVLAAAIHALAARYVADVAPEESEKETTPEEGEKMLHEPHVIYRDTVVSINGKGNQW